MLNIYGIIILAAMLMEFFLNQTAEQLNLSHGERPVPARLADLFSPREYQRSRAYLKANTRLDMVRDSLLLAATLLFWFSGGFRLLDQFCRRSLSELVGGLLFIALLLTGRFLLTLPFSLYSTFVIEEKFGFNRTSLKTFILDRAKIILLALILGLPLLAAILWFFTTFKERAWLLAWLLLAAFTLSMQLVAPIWIMPLFNKFSPLPAGDLQAKLAAFGRRVNFPLDRVMIVDGSRRSGKGNAFFTGFGRNRRVALFDTLVGEHSNDELIAIIAHEIGHYRKKHILKMTLLSLAHQGLILYLLGLILPEKGIYQAFFIDQPSVAAGLVFFSLLYKPLELILTPALQAISRYHEFAADYFAAQSTGQPQALISALKKLSRENLTNPVPHPLYVLLNYSHPPLADRVKALDELSSKEGSKAVDNSPAKPSNPL